MEFSVLVFNPVINPLFNLSESQFPFLDVNMRKHSQRCKLLAKIRKHSCTAPSTVPAVTTGQKPARPLAVCVLWLQPPGKNAAIHRKKREEGKVKEEDEGKKEGHQH